MGYLGPPLSGSDAVDTLPLPEETYEELVRAKTLELGEVPDSSPEVPKHKSLVRGESTAQVETNTVPAPAASAMGSKVTEEGKKGDAMQGSKPSDDGETSPIAPTEPEVTPDKPADSPELPDRPRVHRDDQRELKDLKELNNPKVKKAKQDGKAKNPKAKAKGKGKGRGKKPTMKRPAANASAPSKKRQRVPEAKEEEQEGEESEEEEEQEVDDVAFATQHYSPAPSPTSPMTPKNLDKCFASVDDRDGSKHDGGRKAKDPKKKPARAVKVMGKVKGKGDKKTFAGRAPPQGETAKHRFDVMEKTYNSQILKYIKGTSKIEVRCFGKITFAVLGRNL